MLGILDALLKAFFTHHEAASMSITVGTMTNNMYLKSKNISKLLFKINGTLKRREIVIHNILYAKTAVMVTSFSGYADV